MDAFLIVIFGRLGLLFINFTLVSINIIKVYLSHNMDAFLIVIFGRLGLLFINFTLVSINIIKVYLSHLFKLTNNKNNIKLKHHIMKKLKIFTLIALKYKKDYKKIR
jgi:hypothetical protein